MKDTVARRRQLIQTFHTSAQATAWPLAIRAIGMSPRAITRQMWPSARRRSAWRTTALAIAAAILTLFVMWWSESDQWNTLTFWFALIVAAGTTLSALVPQRPSTQARIAAGLLALRRAVVADDAHAAPLAARQPELVYDLQLSQVRRDRDRVYRSDALAQTGKVASDLFGAGSGAILAALTLLSAGINGSALIPFTGTWELFIANAVLVLVGLVAALRVVSRHRPIRVAATETGLAGRGIGYRRTIPWSELRALCRVEVPYPKALDASGTARQVVFAALGERTTIAWTARPRRGKGAPPISGQVLGEDGEAWRVCGLVAARSGLPLRNLTPAMSEVIAHTSAPRPQKTLRAKLTGDAMALSLPTRSPHAPRPPRVRGMLSFLVVVPLLLALAAAGAALPRYQAQAYANEVAASQAQKPLLADPLTGPSGLWPTGTLPNGTFSFADGNYDVGNPADDCCGAYAWVSPIISAATVEITLHQQGRFDLSEAGLVVRADDVSQTMLVFAVTPNGEWHLNRYHVGSGFDATTDKQEIIYDGALSPVGAIHRGDNATNRLAVIMRGTAYAFFINGQLVGVYHDSGPASGHVGVFADGLADAVSFSDFAAYPALPPSPLLPM